MTTKTKTCEQRIDANLAEHIQEAKRVLEGLPPMGDDYYDENDLKDYGPIDAFNDWALHWDEESGQLELSTGGPADFFVFAGGEDPRIYYHFQDWFDGAVRVLDGENYEVMRRLYDELLTL